MRDFLFVLKIFCVCAITIFCVSASAQSTSELALKNLKRQKWEPAYSLLQKSLAKDSLNVTAKYVLAQYFFSDENPAHNLDSAYTFVTEAISAFQSSSIKQRDRLRRFPLDSGRLVHLLQKIDSVAFTRAKTLHTEKGYTDYIAHFAQATSVEDAVILRDSVAFEDALVENTYQSFESFLQKYPAANQRKAATVHYEKLLLASKTADQTLASYEAFLNEHPNSAYRALVEQTIFEYYTASGEPQRFIDFVHQHPKNTNVKRAIDILFHLVPPRKRPEAWPAQFLTDSLRAIIRLDGEYLVPFLKNGAFGFMNSNAHPVITAGIDSLSHEYICGNIDEDIIVLPNKLITKNGGTIWKENVEHVEEIGAGFLMVVGRACKSLLHKSGFSFGDTCIQDAKILNTKLLAIQSTGKRWSLWSLSGRLLLGDADDIYNVNNVVCVKFGNTIKLLGPTAFEKFPITPEAGGVHQYDDVKLWHNDLLWVKREDRVGLLTQSLQQFIEPSTLSLSPAHFGVIASDSSGSKLYSYNGSISNTYRDIISRFRWIIVKDTTWQFLHPTTLKTASINYDTISFSGPFAIGARDDSIHVYFTASKVWKGKRTTIEFVPGKDSTAFVLVTQGPYKVLYNQHGERVFSSQFDYVHHAGDNHFIVDKKSKRGLVGSDGKTLLPIEYDAISKVNDGVISLLKSSQFGLFDIVRKKQIPCSYAKNLMPYNGRYIAANKNGLMGFIGWDNKPLGKFEFNEIQFWNDTAALVKKNSDWMVYEIKTQKILMNNIRHFTRIRDTRDDQLAIIYKDGSHGVIHNRKGTIIPIAFTDIINVGSTKKPLYFAGQKSAEDPSFTVTYFNDYGESVWQEMYSQEDYDRIYCTE